MKTKSFDFLNFFYGIGAAVILIAAMFKFLGWQYAEELFIIGLSSEAFIFFLSSFEWKTHKKQYHWDRIFPELSAVSVPAVESSADDTVDRLVKHKHLEYFLTELQAMSNASEMLNNAAAKLTVSVEQANDNYGQMAETTLKYKEELERLRQRLTTANFVLDNLERFAHPE